VTSKIYAKTTGLIKNGALMKVFVGTAEVYNEKIDIDTRTGKGLDKVLKKIEPLLFKMSKSAFMRGSSYEDIKQDLVIIAIEGIKSFDPSKNVKLSTFLQIHLRNKLISKIKSENKISNNANIILEQKLPDECKCGSTKFISVVKSFSEKRTCVSCSKVYSKKAFTARQEIPFCVMDEKVDTNEDSGLIFSDLVSADDNILRQSRSDVHSLELIRSISSLDGSIDEQTQKLMYLISFEDYSIADAAQKLGMSNWEANSKLKRLSRNEKIKDLIKK
jgi:RNA polymerase sigma factor (sigma-70 family)